MCIKPKLLSFADLKTVSTNEAALLMSLKPQTLRVWAMNGSGPIQPIKIGNRLRWRLSDLDALLGQGAVK